MFASKKSGRAGKGPVDPNFPNVTLLLHGDGTNGAQNNTFIDSSPNNFTITRNGNTTQGSFSPFGDRWSNYFDGNGDSLVVAANAAFVFGTDDFTIEFWFSGPAQVDKMMVDIRGGAATGNPHVTTDTTGTKLRWGPTNTVSTATIADNTWHHCAVTRASGTVRLWVDGVGDTQVANTTNYSSSQPLRIGNNSFGGNDTTGCISNLRIVKGTALYTANFTPSATPLTAVTGTSILTCQSNRLRDASPNNFTITRNGNVRVEKFSPFAPTAPYLPATVGGSAYFDGAGDSLSVAGMSSAVAGDFTIEGWFYFSAASLGTGVIVLFGPWVSPRSAILLRINAGAIQLYLAGSGVLISSTITLAGISESQWFHVAVVRASNSLKLYINGVQIGSTVTHSTQINLTDFMVGAERTTSTTSDIWNGYISSVRVSTTSALYTANFTPPTAPLTASTNTSLLLNFTNGAIFDNAAMNNLETVGNAQISTAVSKFGTGSMSFDGTGDYLSFRTENYLKIGSGDYTFECWLYRNTTSDAVIYADRQASPDFSGVVFGIRSNKVFLLVSANATSWGINTYTSLLGAVVPTATWSHIAISRSGSSWQVFINGVSQYTSTLAGTISQTAPTAYIGFDPGGVTSLNGYIDDLRITKGVARYVANFTPPALPFPNK